MKVYFAVAVLFLVAAASALEQPRCGLVFDGAVRGVDVDVQGSTARVFASWTGFEDGSERQRVLRYEWAVISENLATEAVLDGQCRLEQGFRGHPDVLGWINVESAEQASATVGLSRGATYYTVVRATTSFGVQKYMNSDGFTVAEVEETLQQREENVEEAKLTERGPGAYAQPNVIYNNDCPIDQRLRKESAGVSVGEFLDSIYGPAEFSRTAQTNIIFTAAVAPLVGQAQGGVADQGDIDDDDGDDDDDVDIGTGSVIGIAIGITFFCCLLVIGIIILTSSASKSDKFGVNVRRNENQEDF
mmetsp:Transcript_62665/g.116548  ORF Transcript_62665/g.116548 Transcript_62665/m.116548 type:complete len:303 (+) Transcript_62665:168-1076(+)